MRPRISAYGFNSFHLDGVLLDHPGFHKAPGAGETDPIRALPSAQLLFRVPLSLRKVASLVQLPAF